MKPILPLLLLATLGCDSTGITGHVDGSSDPVVDPDVADEGPPLYPYLESSDKGECMDDVCPPDDPSVEALEASWAGSTAPDCVNVTHRCAPFNCCTTLSAWIDPSGFAVYINEDETGEECWCVCNYHARYTICGLSSGSWVIAIVGPGLSVGVTVP
jgi:hypothetical protein